MSSINEYYMGILDFVNSLVIKIDEIRIHQNYHMYVKKGLTPPTLQESKYYQNITGSLNIADYKVMWNGVELTRSYLNDNPYLKDILLYNTDIRNKLIKDNPGMSDYIRGVLLDIDMETVLGLDNYSVIYFNNKLIAENELVIIRDIEEYVRLFMSRYNNRKYMIDELYLPTLINSLYSSLVTYLISKKFSYTKTGYVDEYHIANKLNSYKYLYNDSKIFNKRTNIWLYGNIDRLKHYIGRNEVLSTLLYKIFDVNNIGIADIVIDNKLPTLIEANIPDVRYEFYKDEYRFVSTPANTNCYNISNKERTLDELIKILQDNNYIDNLDVFDSYKEDLLLRSTNNTHKTRYMVLDTPEKIKTHYTNSFVFSIANLLYKFKNNNYLFSIDYYNVNDKKLYSLNAKDVETLLVYMLLEYYNLSGDVILHLDGIFDISTINKTDILSKTWYKDKLTKIYDYILNIDNLYISVINQESLRLNIEAIREIESRSWYMLSNLIDTTMVTDVSFIVNNLFKSVDYSYDKDTLHTYIVNNNLESFIGIIDDTLINDFLSKVSGIDIDTTVDILEEFNTYKSFYDKLTSYTVNLLINKDFLDKHIVNNIDNTISIGSKPFVNIKDIDVELYETLTTTLDYFYINNDNVVIYNKADNVAVPMVTSIDLDCLLGDHITTNITESYTKALSGKRYNPEIATYIDHDSITIDSNETILTTNITSIEGYVSIDEDIDDITTVSKTN